MLKPGDIIMRINSKGKINRYKVKKTRGDSVLLYDPKNKTEFETSVNKIDKSNYKIEK